MSTLTRLFTDGLVDCLSCCRWKKWQEVLVVVVVLRLLLLLMLILTLCCGWIRNELEPRIAPAAAIERQVKKTSDGSMCFINPTS